MMKSKLLLMIFVFSFSVFAVQAQKKEKGIYDPGTPVPEKYQPDTRFDNMGYWRRMVKEGLVPVQPVVKVPAATKYSTKLHSRNVATEDSPDIPVTSESSTQSENSIFVDPSDNQHALNSNNSTSASGSVYGANDFKTDDGGDTWYGNLEGTGGENSGDPAVAISLDGRMYNGFIHSSGGQAVAYSEDNGDSWNSVLIADSPGGWSSLLDKNHLWIDNSPSSPYEGVVYSAWTNFGGTNDNEIEISRSEDGGVIWTQVQEISSEVNAGSHNQGVNLGTGPNGEVYAIWTIYDAWPGDENALAMARSFDGGITWETFRILEDIRGIRNTETSKNMRVNAFPSMDVDISNGANRGTIYITWPNIGVPGVNDGPDMDVYMIKSSDDGDTWSEPIKVNQDESGLGKEHYFPWISCDPVTGSLSVIYYDDRNVSSTEVEVFVSTSLDGGETWEDMRVSDVAFTPTPISGLATGYMGDYLGIDSYGGWTYPVWPDNRTGTVMTYVSPFLSGPPPNQPWIVYDSHEINDGSGNNNNQLDFDETLEFSVALKNMGDQPAEDVNVTISSESTFITFDDATENFGDFDVDEVVEIADAFGITVAPQVPDGTQLDFTLTAVDADDSTFVSGFSVEAHAPALSFVSMTVAETSGDMNGFLDAGEEGTISVVLSNPGDFAAEDLVANLSSNGSEITITNTVMSLGDLDAGEQTTALFNIIVGDDVTSGTAVVLPFEANSEYHSVAQEFTIKIGVIVEDWETNGFTSFNWNNNSSTPWETVTDVVYEGTSAAKSGAITHSETSELSIDYGVLADDVISFYYKTSTESGYDFLNFYIDGDLIAQWAGENDWQQAVYDVTAGEHTFAWIYSKDGSASSGSDAVWVDYIEFPAPLRTTAYAGADQDLCIDDVVELEGEATMADEVEWTTSGTGTFADATAMNTIYTPSAEDYTNGAVMLTLSVTGPTETVTSELTVTFYMPPTIAIGAESIAVCADASYEFIAATAENTAAVYWTTSGDGTFDDPNLLGAVYTPGEQDKINGMVDITLTGVGMATCDGVSEEIMLTINPLPSALIVTDTIENCANINFAFDIELQGTAPYQIALPSGDVTADADMYSFEGMFTETTNFKVLSLTDANGCTAMLTDSIMLNVLPILEVDLVEDTTICHNLEITLDITTEGATEYHWMPEDIYTPEITIDSTGIGFGTGIFVATVTAENGCVTQKEIAVTFEDCTGIAENTLNIGMNIFPNPSSGVFTLELNAEKKQEIAIRILNQEGKEVYAKQGISFKSTYSEEIDLRNLADGVYFLNIISEGRKITKKVIINK